MLKEEAEEQEYFKDMELLTPDEQFYKESEFHYNHDFIKFEKS